MIADMQVNVDDLQRDLVADLAICDAATTGPWCWMDTKDSGSGGYWDSLSRSYGEPDATICADSRTWWLCGPDGDFDDEKAVLCGRHLGNLRAKDADFIAEARMAWPIAIRRAIAAEQAMLQLRNLTLTRQDIPADVRQEILAATATEEGDTMSELKYASYAQPLAVSLCPPAVRMVIVDVWPDPQTGQPKHTFHPVIAVRAAVERVYDTTYTKEHPGFEGGTHKDLLDLGWDFNDDRETLSAVFLDFDGSLLSTSDPGYRQGDCARRLACCPWPSEQDEEQLGWLVEQLTKDLARRLARRAGSPRSTS